MRTGRRIGDLLAIGVGVPGPVEFSTGRPINPPIMPGWDRFDVAGWIRQEIDVPVLVDNDVNIMALGERERAWPDTDHLLFVKIATGIGAGVISGGFLQRGAQGTAGDIGHVYVSRGAEIACNCGNFGCLEALASGSAIARALTAAGIAPDRLVIDPGFGYAKTAEHNWELLRRLDELVAIGPPLLVGTSRKAFLGRVGRAPGRERAPLDREVATAVTTVHAARHGAWGVRVHDVVATVDALDVAEALAAGTERMP